MDVLTTLSRWSVDVSIGQLVAVGHITAALVTLCLILGHVRRVEKRRDEMDLRRMYRRGLHEESVPRRLCVLAHCIQVAAAALWPILLVAWCSITCRDRYAQWRIGRRLRDTWGEYEDML